MGIVGDLEGDLVGFDVAGLLVGDPGVGATLVGRPVAFVGVGAIVVTVGDLLGADDGALE